MSLTYVDPNDNDPGNTPGPQDEQPGWMDSVKKTLGGLFSGGEEKLRLPAIDMARWGPVLKSAGLDEKSPEHQLLAAIAGHVNSAPIPREPSMGQKLMGTGLNAAAAGFLRSAGASPTEAIAPATSMVKDWQNRRDMADDTRLKAWQTGGSLVIPQVQGAIQQAEARKILAQQAAANRGRMFGEAPPATTPAPGGAPAAPGAVYPSTPPAPPAATGAATPAGAPPAASAPNPGRTAGAITPGGPLPPEPDRPMYQLGQGPHFFYTEQWRNAADSILRGNIDNNALIASGLKPVDPSKGKEAQAEDVLMQLKKADEAAHQASPAYQGKIAESKAFGEGRVKSSQDMEAKLDQGAEAAQNANRTLDIMRSAFEHTQKSGVLGPGFATSWLTNINNALERVGLPHMETAPIQMINELSNRMGIESMMEEMSAGNGMKGGGQRMFMAFREAVANTSQNPTGFAAIMEAMQALNNMHIARQEAKNEYKGALEARNMPPILDFKAQQYINEKAKGAFDQAAVAIDKVLQNATGGPAPGKGAGAPVMSREDAKAAARALIAKDPTLSADAAMKQVMGSGAGAPAAIAPRAAAPKPSPAPVGKEGDVFDNGSGVGEAITGLHKQFGQGYEPAIMAQKRKRQEEDLQRLRSLALPPPPSSPQNGSSTLAGRGKTPGEAINWADMRSINDVDDGAYVKLGNSIYQRVGQRWVYVDGR